MNNPMEAILVTSPVKRTGQDQVQLALFETDGTARIVPKRAAAQADLAALTSTAAAGATPTKAEFDKVVVDLGTTRTLINALLTKMRTANQLAP